MPLKIGTTNIGTVYHGELPIAAVYKGTTLLYESQKKYELLFSFDVTTAATQIDIPNLNITKDDELVLVSTLETDAGHGFLLYVNGDTTNSNYTYQYLYGNGSSISAARSNFPYFTLGRNGSTVTQTNIKVSNNDRFVFQSYSSMPTGGDSSTLQQINFNVVNTQTVSTITSLSIVAGAANKIFANSSFALYKVSGGTA
jgi:hypothetical protein